MRNTFILILIILLFSIGIFIYQKYGTPKNNVTQSIDQTRSNPAPLSNSSFYIDSINPGTRVTVNELVLGEDGYISIYLDNTDKTLLGKSRILKAGTYNNVAITLDLRINDGDVVMATLMSESGTELKDENKNPLQIQKNVGMVMAHYQNEY